MEKLGIRNRLAPGTGQPRVNMTERKGLLHMRDLFFTGVLMCAFVFTAGSLYYTAAVPRLSENYTEFYILGPGGKAEGYPREIELKNVDEVLLGLVNHECRKVAYNVEMRIDGQTKSNYGPVELKHGQKWEVQAGISAQEISDKSKVEFILTKDEERKPYRTLQLWVGVKQ